MTKKNTTIIWASMIYFLLYSVIGWLYEVTLEVVVYRWEYSDRGVLIGPYCVIYGFGTLLLFALLGGLKKKRIAVWKISVTPLIMFLAIIAISTIIELIGSYIMEAATGGWMWNYTSYPHNFQGRIAVRSSLRFGIGGMFFLYILQPAFEHIVRKLPERVVKTAGICILLLFLAEFTNLFLKFL